jgi:DNA-binding NtrC family response regulator
MDSYRVLIVDDEEMLRNLLVSVLSKQGQNCQTAKDGLEALEKIKNDSFDAVVTDIVMPHMDGITLTKEMVKLYPDLPILIITGHAEEYSAKSAIAAGAREFIKKPFSITELDLRFRKMMRDHETLRREQEKRYDIVFNLQRESSEKIEQLEKKIGTLEGKSHNYDPELWG